MAYSSIIEELQDMHFALGNISTLDIKTIYKPQKVEWTGLIGVAQDFLKERKVNSFLEKSLLGTNYLNVPGFLIQRANMISESFSVNENNYEQEEYAEKVVKLTEECFSLWKSKCPGIESALIDDEIAKGVPLPLGVVTQYYLYRSFAKYPLRETTKKEVAEKNNFLEWRVKKLIEKEKSNPSSTPSTGCLGIFVLFIGLVCFLFSCSLL